MASLQGCIDGLPPSMHMVDHEAEYEKFSIDRTNFSNMYAIDDDIQYHIKTYILPPLKR